MHAPTTINSPAPFDILHPAFQKYFGEGLVPGEPKGASEDFSILADSIGVPYVFWNFGCVESEEWEAAVQEGRTADIPGPHMQNSSWRFSPR